MMKYDICIIGGGAAGLAAAACLDDKFEICIIEKNEIPGRKVLATGGGRCNITNAACPGLKESLGFFAYLGLETYADEEGRYYPYSNKASDVVAALMRKIGPNTHFMYKHAVQNIEKAGDDFLINCTAGSRNVRIQARKVILAAGGKAAPQFGTTGDGYTIARKAGLGVTRVFPILTGIEIDKPDAACWDAIKGIRCRAKVTLMKDGIEIRGEQGELQLTDFGLSGICIFNMTPYIRAEEGESLGEAFARYKIWVDFAPDFEQSQLEGRSSSFGILTEKLADEMDRMVKDVPSIKNVAFGIRGLRGWREAQCTCGGISLEDVNMETMEAREISGLYLAGEVLDIQGPCGGFNLQNAWETAMKAAKAINQSLGEI